MATYRRTIEVPKIATKRWITWASTTGIGTSGSSPAISGVFGDDVDIVGSPGPIPQTEATLLRCIGRAMIWNEDSARNYAGVLYMAGGSNWGIDKDLILGHWVLDDKASPVSNNQQALMFAGKAITEITWDTKAMRKLDEHWKTTSAVNIPNVLLGYVYSGGSADLHVRIVISCLIGFK